MKILLSEIPPEKYAARKPCTVCRENKVAGESYYWYRNASGVLCRGSTCKGCMAEYKRLPRIAEKDRERQRARQAKRYAERLAAGLRTFKQDGRTKNREHQRETCRRWRTNNREKYLESHRKNQLKPYRIAYTLLHGAKRRANEKGEPFTLSRDDFAARIERGVCEVTGIPFVIQVDTRKKTGGGVAGPFSPTLDRVNPKGGYVTENVRLVVWAYNLLKSCWNDEVPLVVARALVAKFGDGSTGKTSPTGG